jgi:hypothetical protein
MALIAIQIDAQGRLGRLVGTGHVLGIVRARRVVLMLMVAKVPGLRSFVLAVRRNGRPAQLDGQQGKQQCSEPAAHAGQSSSDGIGAERKPAMGEGFHWRQLGVHGHAPEPFQVGAGSSDRPMGPRRNRRSDANSSCESGTTLDSAGRAYSRKEDGRSLGRTHPCANSPRDLQDFTNAAMGRIQAPRNGTNVAKPLV